MKPLCAVNWRARPEVDKDMPDSRFHALDLLATLVLVVQQNNRVLFANASFEDVMGLSRRNLQDVDVPGLFVDEAAVAQALKGARRHDFAALRFDAQLKRPGGEPYSVHVVVASSAAQAETIDESLRAYQARKSHGIIFTKLDEAARIGGALDCAIRQKLPILGVCDGQRVPEDWHSPDPRMLVARALKTSRPNWFGLEEESLPTLFGVASTLQSEAAHA